MVSVDHIRILGNGWETYSPHVAGGAPSLHTIHPSSEVSGMGPYVVELLPQSASEKNLNAPRPLKLPRDICPVESLDFVLLTLPWIERAGPLSEESGN